MQSVRSSYIRLTSIPNCNIFSHSGKQKLVVLMEVIVIHTPTHPPTLLKTRSAMQPKIFKNLSPSEGESKY